MLGLGKKREFLLKLLCYGIILFALSFAGWAFLWLGILLVLTITITLRYNSTRWILKKLDLGPDLQTSEDIHLAPILEKLAKKYEIKKPTLFKVKIPLPLVIGLGSPDSSMVAYSEPFLNKLSANEKEALLEIAIHKIESEFCKNIEFVTHFNSFLLFAGSKLDLIIAFVIGLKRNKKIETQHYILFSRFSMLAVRVINYFYMNKKVFSKFDDVTHQNNPHLALALNKTLIYSPLEKMSAHPLLTPFNFCNFPRYVQWHRHLEMQPKIEDRLNSFQTDRNLMLQSLSI